MGRRVAVAAHNRVAGKCQAVFRADNVYDTVLRMSEAEESDTEIGCVAGQGFYLVARHGVSYRFVLVECGDVVVGRAECLFRTENLQPSLTQAVKCLWACHFVAVMTVDIELGRAAWYVVDHMRIPDFVKQSFSHDLGVYFINVRIC